MALGWKPAEPVPDRPTESGGSAWVELMVAAADPGGGFAVKGKPPA
jgi:hypothetical protein